MWLSRRIETPIVRDRGRFARLGLNVEDLGDRLLIPRSGRTDISYVGVSKGKVARIGGPWG